MLKQFVKTKVEYVLNKIHVKIFDAQIGETSIDFVKNVSVSIFGGLFAFVLLFVASVITARVIGPAEYGKYAVVFSIAQMLSLFFVLELDVSLLYFLSKKSKQSKVIAASILTMFFINIVIFSLLATSIYKLVDSGNISQLVFVLAVIMALSFALKRIIDAFLRAKERFKIQSILKNTEALSVIGLLFVLFFIFDKKDYYSYITAIILGGFIFSIIGFVFVRKNLSIRGATKECMNTVFRYNVFGIIGAAINSIVKNVDKLIIVAFLGTTMGGIYAVYFTSSVIIGAKITQLFIQVLFPTLRKNDHNLRSAFEKVNILFIKTFVPFICAASLGVAFIVFLYGNQYPLDFVWIVLSGSYIAVHFFAAIYGWMLSSVSKDGYKQYNVSFIYSLVGYASFILIIFLNDLIGITSLLISFIIYRTIGGTVSYVELKNKLI